ncbi:hypothetical protein OROGR_001621 [Orobanche gracilis]
MQTLIYKFRKHLNGMCIHEPTNQTFDDRDFDVFVAGHSPKEGVRVFFTYGKPCMKKVGSLSYDRLNFKADGSGSEFVYNYLKER